MTDKLMDAAAQQGFIAILLVAMGISMFFLIKWVLAKNDTREQRYITVIEEQAKAVGKIDGIQEDVKQIKDYLLVRGR